MPWSVTEEELTDVFGECGDITGIRIQEDRDGRRRGFGFVEFASEDAAKAAIERDGVMLGGRNLRVDYTSRSSHGCAHPSLAHARARCATSHACL